MSEKLIECRCFACKKPGKIPESEFGKKKPICAECAEGERVYYTLLPIPDAMRRILEALRNFGPQMTATKLKKATGLDDKLLKVAVGKLLRKGDVGQLGTDEYKVFV